MDFIAAMDAPVSRTIDGQIVEFPVWSLEEISSCASRLAAIRWENAKLAAKESKVSALDMATLLGQVALSSPTPWDVARYFDTQAGAVECLTASLRKAGRTNEQAKAIVGRLYPSELIELSRLVGRIMAPPMPDGVTDPTEGSASAATGLTS